MSGASVAVAQHAIDGSSFESWFASLPVHPEEGDKQRARDAYAAGMCDPLVQPAPAAHGNHADLLREAAELFRRYEQLHRARGPEHLAKADRNAEIAGRIEAALTNTTGEQK